jgi:hypothetical protein
LFSAGGLSGWLYAVSHLLQFADHALNPVFQPERIGLISLFDVLDAFMEDLPDQPAEPVGGRPDGFAVSQAYDKTAVEFLKKNCLWCVRRRWRPG